MVTEEELLEAIDTIDDLPKEFFCLYHTKMEQYVAINDVRTFYMHDLGEGTLLLSRITSEVLTDMAIMLKRIDISIDDIVIVPSDYVLRTDFTQAVEAIKW